MLALPFLLSTLFFPAHICQGAEALESDVYSYFKVLWGLVVVLGIILVLYGLLRKRFSLFASGSHQDIKVLEVRPLMGKKALCLVNVRGKDFLLGISDSQITTISTFPAQSGDDFSEVLEKITSAKEEE